MNLYQIDYIAVSGVSPLHRLPAGVKLCVVGLLIAALLLWQAWPVAAAAFGVLLLLAVAAQVPLRSLLALVTYPLVFLAILLLSVRHLSLLAALPLVLRVLAITTAVVLLLLTTTYPAIFSALGRVLPRSMVTALFFTYRALFILNTSLDNARTALHLRGGVSWRHPAASLRNLGTALAHVLVDAIELSQRMAENLTIRGFDNRIYTLERHP
jgi:biotin transport system permease protein